MLVDANILIYYFAPHAIFVVVIQPQPCQTERHRKRQDHLQKAGKVISNRESTSHRDICRAVRGLHQRQRPFIVVFSVQRQWS